MTDDLTRVIAEYRQIITYKGPEYIYEQPDSTHACVYFEPWMLTEYDQELDEFVEVGTNPVGGYPICIVGHWLSAKGLTVDHLGDLNDDGVSNLVKRLPVWRDLQISEPAQHFMESIQSLQDRKEPWGSAFNKALANTQALTSVDLSHEPRFDMTATN